MSYNVKNYMEQGGDRLVIGGTLEIKEGASVLGLPSCDSPANETTLGVVKAAAKSETDTVEVKIGDDDKLYVPAYPPEYTLPAATEETSGGVLLAANQAASEAATVETLRDDLNVLLTALKASGIMAVDAQG